MIDTVFDWRPHIERLRKDAETAAQNRRPDPWAIAEAECWIELIDAEIAAHRALPQTREEVVDALKQLATWKGELKLIVRRLRSVKGGGRGGPTFAGVAGLSQPTAPDSQM